MSDYGEGVRTYRIGGELRSGTLGSVLGITLASLSSLCTLRRSAYVIADQQAGFAIFAYETASRPHSSWTMATHVTATHCVCLLRVLEKGRGAKGR